MTKLLIAVVLLLLLLLSDCRDASVPAIGDDESIPASTDNVSSTSTSMFEQKLLPPSSGVYHSAYADFGKTEDKVSTYRIRQFTKLVGKPIVWAYFSNNWIKKIRFPKSQVRVITRAGSIPFIRMMPRSSFAKGPDPVYTLQAIIDGQFDASLIQWAIDARAMNIPLIVEFGTEANGDWFPWSGTWNGGSETDGYGDPLLPDGPERFRDAYRHIIDLFRVQGVQNITWVFHPNGRSSPDEPWNSLEVYYPGDEYIDWIGVSAYGPIFNGESWTPFADEMDAIYPTLTAIAPLKPVAVLEFGALEQDPVGQKAVWIREALDAILQGRYSQIKAISYWHSKWRNSDRSTSNLRLDSSPKALQAYKEKIADSFFVTIPNFSTPVLP